MTPSFRHVRSTAKASVRLLLSASALAGCTTFKPPQISYDDVGAAVLPDPPMPVEIVELPKPLPLPGQLKPLAWRQDTRRKPPIRRRGSTWPTPPRASSRSATVSSTPSRSFPSSGGALYQIYAAPGQITDIALEPGEQLIGSGPLAAGDTVRWIVGDTESGNGDTKRVHILVKPTRPDLVTNLVINTDRRTYLLELRSTREDLHGLGRLALSGRSAHPLRRQNAAAAAAAPIDAGVDISKLASAT